jgi:hypothetical protein
MCRWERKEADERDFEGMEWLINQKFKGFRSVDVESWDQGCQVDNDAIMKEIKELKNANNKKGMFQTEIRDRYGDSIASRSAQNESRGDSGSICSVFPSFELYYRREKRIIDTFTLKISQLSEDKSKLIKEMKRLKMVWFLDLMYQIFRKPYLYQKFFQADFEDIMSLDLSNEEAWVQTFLKFRKRLIKAKVEIQLLFTQPLNLQLKSLKSP